MNKQPGKTDIMLFSRWFRCAVLVLAAGMGATPLSADEVKRGNLVIDHAWSRATIGTSRPGVAYLTIKNTGAVPDRLVAAESPRASRIGLHLSRREDGVMKMRHVQGIAIPAGGAVALKPGGYHLMLMGLKAPLKAGENLPLTLTFEKAGTVTLEATVEKLGGGTMNPMNPMDPGGH